MRFLYLPPLPADTARAAESAFGRDHLYLRIGRKLDVILADFELPPAVLQDFVLAETFWPYSLATILQYWEDLTDHQMVDVVRTRLDLKYALHLPMNFPGFKSLALCEFRQHLLPGKDAKAAFQEMVNRLKEFAGDPGKGQAGAEQIIATLCLLSRTEIIVESMSMALEAVAVRRPDWLLTNALPHWYKLYYHQPGPQQIPRDTQKITDLLQTIGKDAQHLLAAIEKTNALDCRRLPEIEALRRVTAEHFEQVAGELRWRRAGCASCERVTHHL